MCEGVRWYTVDIGAGQSKRSLTRDHHKLSHLRVASHHHHNHHHNQSLPTTTTTTQSFPLTGTSHFHTSDILYRFVTRNLSLLQPNSPRHAALRPFLPNTKAETCACFKLT
ncbi:hypothetical protein E2C01_003111 [Portunus trituberculatus]|uniref:Uncharacterized protein n=1 Tax=Portunus trituberculatus TaxID=210409 RepID=A0A5B7CPB7_PORTR|nr:hypothetical protein [Portunus trituberculatus]